MNENKHLVYAEDVIYAIMQHPSKNITKSIVKQLIDEVVETKEVNIGSVMPVAMC